MTDKKTPADNASPDSTSPDNKVPSNSDKKATDSAGISASITLSSSNDKKNTATTNKSEKEADVPKTSSARTHTATTKTTPTRTGRTPATSNTSISKLAILALFIALLSAGGVGGLYWFNNQQLTNERQAIQQELAAQQLENKAHVAQLFEQKIATLTTQLNQALTQQTTTSNTRVSQVEQQLNRLQQVNSSDWLVHEAEYLIRISSRALWLEKNTSTAISLLKDADRRLNELNDPQYLPTRQAIRNDIESLQLLPMLDTENILLSLSAISQQVNKLPLAMVKIPDSTEQQEYLALSDNTDDWQANLAKTWRKFLADFITVRRRTGNVEPLMSPQHQQNLRENLMLKLQVAQWAATKHQTQVYQQTLADVTLWLNDYFDVSQPTSKKFLQKINTLAAQTVDVEYPSGLSALKQIRILLTEKTLVPLANGAKQTDTEPKATNTSVQPNNASTQTNNVNQQSEKN